MKTRRWMASLAAMSAIALAAGCSSGQTSSESSGGATGTGGLPDTASPQEVVSQTTQALEGKTVRLALVTEGIPLTNEWVNSMRAGFEQAGADFQASSANFDPQALAQIVETFVNQQPDVLIIHNSDLSGLANLIQRAQREGIYVLVINLASNAQSDAYIGPNWDKMTAMLANRAADDCQAKGRNKVAIINGFGADSASVLVSTAAERVFAERGMQVVANQPGQFDPNTAREIASTVMEQHPDLCAFLGSWDGMMIGAAAAVKQAGKSETVGVYTVDSSNPTCAAIAEGTITAAVNYGVEDMGPQAVAVAKYLMQSGVAPGSGKTALFTELSMIDSSNVHEGQACYDGTVL